MLIFKRLFETVEFVSKKRKLRNCHCFHQSPVPPPGLLPGLFKQYAKAWNVNPSSLLVNCVW